MLFPINMEAGAWMIRLNAPARVHFCAERSSQMNNAAYKLESTGVGTKEKSEVLKTEADYYNMPDDVRAELIDGEIIIMESPRATHQALLAELVYYIKEYIRKNKGNCKVLPDFDTKLSTADATIVRPDISVICDPDKITERRCEGAPDWIIEIVSPGNPRHDYLKKLELYQRVGVREYWIADPMKRAVIVYHLEDSAFDMTAYTFHDKIRVGIYDDFVIDFSAVDESI